MPPTKSTATDETASGVRAKLKAHKEANAGTRNLSLPNSGVTVQVPNFIAHGIWQKAQRPAKGDAARAQAEYIMAAVTFEGERLTYADVQAGLISAPDMLFLINELFGDQAGNA